MIPYNIGFCHVVEGREVRDLPDEVFPVVIHLATYKVAVSEDGTEGAELVGQVEQRVF